MMDDGAQPGAGWMGQPVPRREDARLLTGAGRYADDTAPPDAAVAVFLRSPEAHAAIRRLDTSAARAMPGVLAILTGTDLRDAGYRPLPCPAPVQPEPGTTFHKPPRPALALDHVRHVGEPVALIVAETANAARDALESIVLDLDALPAVDTLSDALHDDAPLVWPAIPGNIAVSSTAGDAAAVARAMAQAAHVVELTIPVTRVTATALEPRNAWATHDAAQGFTLVTGSQGVGNFHRLLIQSLPPGAPPVRVITQDVGGGFGMKTQPYPEHVALLAAAQHTGRPVRWLNDRSESLLSDNHGRDCLYHARLALDAQGHFLALDLLGAQAMGAYLSAAGAMIAVNTPLRCLSSVYRIPAMHARMRCVMTNTAPVGPYRGAGRPEANLIVESLVEAAAQTTGIDRIALRRRNLIAPADLPYATPFGETYDSGDFAGVLDRALALADWDGFATRRAADHAAGHLRGIGLCCYLEATGAVAQESARIRFAPDGTLELRTGAQSNGQGHETAFVQIVAQGLGLPLDALRLLPGDSAALATGNGTVGSRSMVAAGSAAWRAAAACRAQALTAAAAHFGVDEAALDMADGLLRVSGTNRAIALGELAIATRRPDGSTPLDVDLEARDGVSTYPNGAHVAEVLIDPETGAVTVSRYSGVDDMGRLINPLLAEGQIQGGVVQGIGQVLGERIEYRDGQLLTGSFMDYAMPRADWVPALHFEFHPVPTARNPLGAKGGGEAGTTGAIAATLLAVNDALASAGAGPIAMPATPLRVWQALAGGA